MTSVSDLFFFFFKNIQLLIISLIMDLLSSGWGGRVKVAGRAEHHPRQLKRDRLQSSITQLETGTTQKSLASRLCRSEDDSAVAAQQNGCPWCGVSGPCVCQSLCATLVAGESLRPAHSPASLVNPTPRYPRPRPPAN